MADVRECCNTLVQPWVDPFEKPNQFRGQRVSALAALLVLVRRPRVAESDFLSPGSHVNLLGEQP